MEKNGKNKVDRQSVKRGCSKKSQWKQEYVECDKFTVYFCAKLLKEEWLANQQEDGD